MGTSVTGKCTHRQQIARSPAQACVGTEFEPACVTDFELTTWFEPRAFGAKSVAT